MPTGMRMKSRKNTSSLEACTGNSWRTLPGFQASSYTAAWKLIGNALPGTFAMRSLGVWLKVRYAASLDLRVILLEMVEGHIPVGLRCSNRTGGDRPNGCQPTMGKPTDHSTPPPGHVASQGVGGLFPAAAPNLMARTASSSGPSHALTKGALAGLPGSAIGFSPTGCGGPPNHEGPGTAIASSLTLPHTPLATTPRLGGALVRPATQGQDGVCMK